MPNDIRSYFKPVASTPKTAVKPKRTVPVTISSDEDVVAQTPEKVKVKLTNLKKRKVILSDSDSDCESKKNIKRTRSGHDNPELELKKVNVEDILGSTPVKQAKVKIKPENKNESAGNASQPKKISRKKKLKTEVGVHDDEDFEKSLLELDEDVLLNNVNKLDKTIESELNKIKEEPTAENLEKSDFKKDTETPGKRKKSPNKHEPHSPENKRTKTFPSKDAHMESDQERHERRVHSAALYQKYLNRGGPPHHGSKELPKGKPDCLRNLCFLRTGVLDSLESYEFEELIKEHGGRVVHAVSKRLNYIVVGEEPGPAKLEKAKNYGIPTMSEDELLDLIRIKSEMKPIYTTSESKEFQDIKQEGETSIMPPKEEQKSLKYPYTEENKTQERNTKTTTPKKTHSIKKILAEEELAKEAVKSSKNKIRSLTPKKDYLSKEILNGKEAVSMGCDKKIDLSKASPEYETLPLTEKYKPQNVKGIVGQQGDHSNLKKLMTWLQNWHKNNQSRNVKSASRNEPGALFKAALLSGPPGVGKTTTSTLVAKELGFDVVEFNASDTRNKKLLHEEVSQLLSTKTIAGFVRDGSQPTSKRVLIMDEVDGMAGNEDRGGIQELVNLIKNTHIPIICMCNDRNHQKVRSLANHCFDLRFQRPRLEQIRAFLMTVCFRENLEVPLQALNEIIAGSGMDLRQCLNNLAMWVAGEKSLSVETAKKEATLAKKDAILGPWDVCRKIFNGKDHEVMSIADRGRLFFYDYSLAPLFVQENYLHVIPDGPREQRILRASKTSDSLSFADLLDKKIRSSNNWSLLEVESMFVTVIPGTYMRGHFGGQINFPSWLGKNSKRNKFQRIATDIQAHMRTSTSASRLSVNLDYISYLRNRILAPLLKKKMDGIQEAIDIMNAYKLSRADLDGILELAHWHGRRNPSDQLDSKVKAAFTRQFRKEGLLLPYAASSTSVKKRAASSEDLLNDEEEFVEDDANEGEDDITKDSNIKVKKTTQKVAKGKDEASTSGRKKGGGKGKKKKSKE